MSRESGGGAEDRGAVRAPLNSISPPSLDRGGSYSVYSQSFARTHPRRSRCAGGHTARRARALARLSSPAAVGDKAVFDGPENAATARNLGHLASLLVMRCS